jgi:hypothetical protein
VNDDFNATNSDFNSGVYTNVGISFVLEELIEKPQLRRLGELECYETN